VPTLYGPGWPPTAEAWPPTSGQPPTPGQRPPAGPERLSTDLIGGTGRIYPVRPRPRPGRTNLILAAAAVVIVVVAVAVVVSLVKSSAPGTSAPHTGSSAPSSPALASRQAAAVSNLLGSSAATRNTLVGAIRKAHNCVRLPSAVRQIQVVVNRRSAELNHAVALSTGALANGATVRSDLLAALRHSLDADREYLAWAQQQLTSGCRPTARSSAYRAALNADGQADAAKTAFVQAWNPIAARYRLPQKSPGDI
jgi:hypothetical protein